MSPQNDIEPIGIAAKIIVRLETLPIELKSSPAVIISYRAFHAGEPHGDYNTNIKTYDKKTRKKVLEAVKQIIQEEVKAVRISRKPRIDARTRAPITENTPTVMKAIQKTFKTHF